MAGGKPFANMVICAVARVTLRCSKIGRDPTHLMHNGEGSDGCVGGFADQRSSAQFEPLIIPAPPWARLKMIFLRQTKI
jgi:hypothetical protein